MIFVHCKMAPKTNNFVKINLLLTEHFLINNCGKFVFLFLKKNKGELRLVDYS